MSQRRDFGGHFDIEQCLLRSMKTSLSVNVIGLQCYRYLFCLRKKYLSLKSDETVLQNRYI